MSPCGDLPGCWDQSDVNIGWYGYRCVGGNAEVRVGPGFHFPARGVIEAGKRVGWQSLRNPSARDRPRKRAVKLDGGNRPWAWVYKIDGGLTGWFPVDHLEPHDTGTGWARGPAGVDMHVGYDECTKGKPVGCGGRRTGVMRHVDADEVYLRYAPQSTAFYLLQRGDRLYEMYRSSMPYACVEVRASESAPRRARGWAHTDWIS